MYWHFTPYLIPLIITTVVSLMLGVLAWTRNTTGAKTFAGLVLIVAFWTFGYTLELAATGLALKIFWSKIEYLGIVSLPVMWAVFAIHFSNRSHWLTRRHLVLLFIVPLITLTLFWTNEAHGLIWQKVTLADASPLLTLSIVHGLWFWVHLVYSYALLLFGTILLTLMLLRSVHIYRWQTLLLLSGIMAPWVGNWIYLAGLSPVPNLDTTPFAFAFSCFAFGWGFYRFRLLDIAPIARSAVVDVMSDAVIVLDTHNKIVDLNLAATQLLNRARTEIIGRRDLDVLAVWPGWVEHFHALSEGQGEIALGPADAPRYYDLHISQLDYQTTRAAGRLVVLRDITRRRETEELMHLTQFSVDQAVDPTFWVARDGRLAYVNEAACRYLGYTKQELLQLKIHDIDPNYSADVWPSHWRSLESRGSFMVESRHLSKNNGAIPVELTFNYLEFRGKAYSYLCARDITWRRWAVQELMESEERLERVISSISDFVYMTEFKTGEKPVNRFISPKVETLTGYPVEKFVSNWKFWQSLIHPEDQEIASAQLTAFEQGHNSAVEYRMIHANGNIIWVRDSGQVKKHSTQEHLSAYGVVRDITEQKQAEAALRESENRLRHVISSITGHIYVTEMTLAGAQISNIVSPNIEHLTGYPVEKFTNDWYFWQSLIHPEDRALAAAQVARFAHCEKCEVEYRLIRADGEVVWVRDSVRVEKDVEQQKMTIFGVANDITPHKEAEEALQRAHDQAMEANQFKSQLLAKVSHELRTPLGAILGFAELLEMGMNGPLSESQQATVAEIIESTHYLTSLVNELLDQAQLDAGKLRLHNQPVALIPLIDETLSRLDVLATSKRIRLTQQVEMAVPPVISADAKRIQQVIVNLLSNAIKFTTEGSVHLHVSRPDDAHWQLQVTDTGAGIPPEALEHIFEPFQQADNSVTREHGGSGLGLSIVKQLTLLMDGEITVQSEMGRGSTFTVRLPLEPVPEAELA